MRHHVCFISICFCCPITLSEEFHDSAHKKIIDKITCDDNMITRYSTWCQVSCVLYLILSEANEALWQVVESADRYLHHLFFPDRLLKCAELRINENSVALISAYCVWQRNSVNNDLLLASKLSHHVRYLSMTHRWASSVRIWIREYGASNKKTFNSVRLLSELRTG